VRRQEAQTLAGMVEPSADGSVEVTVSKDQMLVHGTFFPPAGNGKPIELDAVRSRIESLKVTFGIDWEAVKGCILTCNEERSRVSDAVIARGKKPANEVPAYLVIGENLRPREKTEDSSSARVDFREVSPFTLVKAGDVLATVMPKQDGVMGTTV